MIEAILYGALGFFLAGLVAVLFVPALWNRAVRITRRQLEDSLPMSSAEIQADKDCLRAQFATELRQLETELEKAKAKTVRELVESSKRRVRIDELESELSDLKARLEESESAKQALEQTLSRGLPRMEQELEAAREAMAEIEQADAELRYRYGRDKEALRTAQTTVKRQAEEIRHLRAALQADDLPIRRFFDRSDSALAKENRRLLARLSELTEESAMARHADSENYLLRKEMRNLSLQILRAAQGEDAPLPEFVPEEPPEDLEGYRRISASLARSAPADGTAEDGEETLSDVDENLPPGWGADPDRPTRYERQGKAGFRSRLKQKLRGQPKSAGGESEAGRTGQSEAKPESLSQRLAARRGSTPKSATSSGKTAAASGGKAEAPEPVGSE